MFQGPPAPSAGPASGPLGPAPGPAEPGEFTRMFQGSAPAGGASKGGVSEPGEFTRMFRPGGTPPAPPPNPAAALPQYAAPTPAGDVPQFFNRPPEMALSEPAKAAGGAPASEFTRMMHGFNEPGAPAERPLFPSAGPPPPKTGQGEFTRMLETPLPSLKPGQQFTPPPSGAGRGEPGEFTRMLEAQVDATPRGYRQSSRLQSGGDATQAFSMNELPVAPPAGPEEGTASGEPTESEYTKLFKAPPKAPAAAPAPAAVKPVIKQKTGSYTPLIVIAVLLFLVMFGIIIYLLAR